MNTNLDVAQISQFSPINGMKTKNIRALLEKIDVQTASPGATVFRKRDKEKRSFYLIDGKIELRDGGAVIQTIEGGTDEARKPVSPTIPREHTAFAVGEVTYFSIDSEFLDVALTLDQTGIYEVSDFSSQQDGEQGDWMTALLRIKTFQMIPPQNIQQIFMRMTQVNHKSGDVVLKQGSSGDYFYVIRTGRCLVTRESPAGNNNVNLAELTVGDTFGEEALLTETKRSATVTMLTDGVLMRLARQDFQSLLSEPLLDWVDHDEADSLASNDVEWLDVRLPSEFKDSGREGALNIPLYMLRHKLDLLNSKSRYLVCCDTGRRSSAAAFILNQKSFQTVVLKGGLNCTEN